MILLYSNRKHCQFGHVTALIIRLSACKQAYKRSPSHYRQQATHTPTPTVHSSALLPEAVHVHHNRQVMSRHFSILIAVLFCSLMSISVLSSPISITSEQTCGANSFWTPYGTDCPPNCQNGGVPPPCIKMFVPSCQCLSGFVFRLGKSGDCIRLEECMHTD